MQRLRFTSLEKRAKTSRQLSVQLTTGLNSEGRTAVTRGAAKLLKMIADTSDVFTRKSSDPARSCAVHRWTAVIQSSFQEPRECL